MRRQIISYPDDVFYQPNLLIEFADWASAEVRAAAMQEAMAIGDGRRRLRTSVGAVSRAIQSYGYQATVLM